MTLKNNCLISIWKPPPRLDGNGSKHPVKVSIKICRQIWYSKTLLRVSFGDSDSRDATVPAVTLQNVGSFLPVFFQQVDFYCIFLENVGYKSALLSQKTYSDPDFNLSALVIRHSSANKLWLSMCFQIMCWYLSVIAHTCMPELKYACKFNQFRAQSINH